MSAFSMFKMALCSNLAAWGGKKAAAPLLPSLREPALLSRSRSLSLSRSAAPRPAEEEEEEEEEEE
jgi:hypothetical protein